MMQTELELPINLDTDFGFLEGVPAVFDIEVETCPAEPFSWGESRGDETFVSARFKSLKLNGLTLRENEATTWLGYEQINRIETLIEETFIEETFIEEVEE